MIKVRDIMTKEVIIAAPNSSIVDAAKLMASKSVTSLVVVENGIPVGVIGENDVIVGITSKKAKVRDVMGRDFIPISPSARFLELEKYVRQKKIKRFPVVENGKLVGIVTETDIIEATRDFTRFNQLVQEVILGIFGLATAFFLFYFSPLGSSIFR